MENKCLILSDEHQIKNLNCSIYKKSAVIINLYYEDCVEKYFSYIMNIPSEIAVYVFSSNQSVCEKIKSSKVCLEKRNLVVIQKENRGRDISALLVAAKKIVNDYEYICFIHDKKAHADYLKEDVEAWIEGLWINMLGSEKYICNILDVFETDETIGLMVPPKPMGKYSTTLRNCWHKNYNNTVKLAERLGLNCCISEEVSPTAIGTVFWGRTEALRKLFIVNWKYEDFVEEPMPYDGTISHAIERILPYVVEDAGYETKTVVANKFAQKQIVSMQTIIEKTYDILNEKIGVGCINSLENFSAEYKKVCDFCENNKAIYIYGAGEIAQQCIRLLKLHGYVPKGVVTSQSTSEKKLQNLERYTLAEVKGKKESAFIVAVSWKYEKEVVQNLEANGFTNYITLDGLNK